MKKVLVAILLLIPLIVVLTVNVSSMIISAEIAKDVESIILHHDDELLSSEQVITVLQSHYTVDNMSYNITATVLPEDATNREVDWEAFSRAYDGSDEPLVELKKISRSMVAVYFIEGRFGDVTITAYSAGNHTSNATTSCVIHITDDHLYDVGLYNYANKQRLSSITMLTGDTQLIYADPLPVEAVKGKEIQWSSSNEGVVSVNANGEITALKSGKAVISASASDTEPRFGKDVTIVSKLDVTVLDNPLPNIAPLMYTKGESLNLGALLPVGAEVFMDGERITDASALPVGAKVDVRYNNATQQVIVCHALENQLIIPTLYNLQNAQWNNGNLMTVEERILLSAKAAYSNTSPAITWTSDHPDVLRVDATGAIVALKEGTATITASASGYLPASVTIDAYDGIYSFGFIMDNNRDKRGLGQKHVFGIYNCVDELEEGGEPTIRITNTLPLHIQNTHPVSLAEKSDWYRFVLFESSNENYATVNDEGVITFSRESIGQKVTITATARQGIHPARASYTFSLVDGINIGYGKRVTYNYAVPEELPDFRPFVHLKYVADTYLEDVENLGVVSGIVFQSNIYIPANASVPNFFRSIYGNGYIYDGQLHCSEFDSRMFGTRIPWKKIQTVPGYEDRTKRFDIVIDNLYIQSYRAIKTKKDGGEVADDEDAWKVLKLRGGVPIRVDNNNRGGGEIDELQNIYLTFHHCLFQYSYSHINPSHGKFIIDGCIFRNSAGPAIMTQAYPGYKVYTDFTIRNCIFSNTISPVIMSSEADWRSDWSLEYKNSTNHTIFRFEKDNYIYNWKKIRDTEHGDAANEVDLDIFPPKEGEFGALVSALSMNISKLFQIAIGDEANKDLVVDKGDGNVWINLGFVALGVWMDLNMQELNPNLENPYEVGFSIYSDNPDRISIMPIDMRPLIPYLESNAYKAMYAVAKQYDVDLVNHTSYFIDVLGKDGKPNTTPDATYDINQETLDKLNGISKEKDR